MTRFCLRTHRPVHPAEAKRARISLWVQGFLPGDGTSGTNDNYVWFDNVYFFKAPDVVQVTGYGSGSGNFQSIPGPSEPLSMWVEIKDVNDHGYNYIHIFGAVRNDDTDTGHNPRAVDLGFALPVLDAELGQSVTWWDDARNGTEVAVPAPNNWVPYRFTGPVDQRAAARLEMLAESGDDLENVSTRAGNNQLSAYPFSVIDIENGSNGPYGVSFGEHLLDIVSQTPADPQVAHFGYHIEQPTSPFIGRYYVEFNLGLLKPGDEGDAETPFSFILFRSDDPASPESSSFRDGAEKYQTVFFPFAFTRPTQVPQGDDWLFGGGIFIPQWNSQMNNWWQMGFTMNPADFGLRYTRTGAAGLLDDYLTYGLSRDVRVLIYDRPWTARFEHGDPSADDANTYTELRDQALDPLGGPLYLAQYDHRLVQLNANGGTADLFSRGIEVDDQQYKFPVLLADLDDPANPIVDRLQSMYGNSYSNISVPHDNPEGLAGLMYDNVFNDMHSANHLDQDDTRLEGYRSAGGAPTYSFNNFMPAIPQLVANTRFLDSVDAKLDDIDSEEHSGLYTYGEGNGATQNTTGELLGGNIAQADFGGTKYALMKFDIAGFESNAATAFNSSEETLSFMRSMARDKSMTRQLLEFPCLVPCEGSENGILEDFATLDLADDFIDENTLRVALVNEATWMTLAWGFHPGVSKYFPHWGPNPGDDQEKQYYQFVDEDLRPLFNYQDPYEPRLGYTHIFRELHLAGWDPVTNVELELENSGQAISDLYWERFGGYNGEPGPSNPTYVTVLNNQGLQFTLVELFEHKFSDLPRLKEIEDEQQLRDLNLCEELFAPGREAVECGDIDFDVRDKDIRVKIYDPIAMGLWANNIHGVQLVGYSPPSRLCNAPDIVAAYIEEGPTYGTYSIFRHLSQQGAVVSIGGEWPIGGQQSFTIQDKALMVFKLWSSDVAGNGRSGGDGEDDGSAEGGQATDEPLISAYYERYGQGWIRSEAPGGHEGNTDVVRADSPGACAYFKIHSGRSGHHEVRVHYPPMAQATGAALYEVYLTDYLLDPAGSVDLGEPLFSALVDQSDADAYATARQADGFVTIGELDIDVDEGSEVATVVVRASAPYGESESVGGTPTLLLADAVRLALIE